MPDISQPGATPGATSPGATPGQGGNAGNIVSQGPNDPIQPQQPAQPATGDDDEQLGESGRLALRREREARQAAEAAARDSARQLEELRRSSLSDEERKRLQTLDQQIEAQKLRERNLILRYEIASRATRLGLVDPEIAVLLLEKKQSISVDDTGQVTGLDEALKDLIKERPHLVKAAATPIDGGAGAGGSRAQGRPGMNDIIRSAARGRTVGG